MPYKGFRKSGLRDPAKIRAQAGRVNARREREERALALWRSLAGEYRRVHSLPEDAPINPADELLLQAAVSAALEISVTTARLVHGCARPKGMRNLGAARGELRRALRSLGMIGDSGDAGTNDDNVMPRPPTDEAMREVVAAFGGTPKEAVNGSHEPD
jgi:hypothetical protein